MNIGHRRTFGTLEGIAGKPLILGWAAAQSLLDGRRMTDRPYNYDTFRRPMVEEDMGFSGGPRSGEPAPEIDLPTVDGGRFRLGDHRGVRPVLLQFGSAT